MRLNVTLLLLPLALLAACGDGSTSGEDGGRSATGEVLEGTISDGMLPLATITSQPPLLPPEEQEDGSDEEAAPGAAPTGSGPAEPGAVPPAPVPTGQPSAAADPPGDD